MSSSIVWQGTIVDDSGGTLLHKQYENETTVRNTNRYIHCGFICRRNSYIPPVDKYESTSYQGFIRFPVPSSSDPINSVTLYLWYYGGNIVEANNLLDYVDVQVWARQSYDVTKFPWQTLDVDDYSDGWVQVGTLGNIRSYFFSGSQGWKSIDVTSAFQAAVNAGWSVFAIRLVPSHTAPSDWNYSNAPTVGWGPWNSVNEDCHATFYGQRAQDITDVLPGTYGSDTGYDWIYTRPWLKIDYDTTTPPTPTPATVNVVAADSKAKVCLAGTGTGSLWKIFKSSSGWQAGKSHNFGDAVTAIYIDTIRNFKDYPRTALVWVGTSGGDLYKSYGLKNWTLISSGQWGSDPFVEIRGSDVDSDKVVVAVGTAIYTTVNGGTTWNQCSVESLIEGRSVTGLYVKGNEIQVLFDGGGGFRSPDFGVTWYTMQGIPSSSIDIAFSRNNETRSVIVANGNLYKYSSGITNFTYIAGASITGTPRAIDADPEGELMIVGTSSNLYQTPDWGSTVNIIRSGVDAKSVALGGGYLYNP